MEVLEDRTVLSPLSLTADNLAVSGSNGAVASNTGTFSDTNSGATVQLSASAGAVTANGNGTWNWSETTPSGAAQTAPVTIYATDSQGATAATEFWLNVGSTFTVTSTGDNGGVNPAPGAGTGTLRQAIVDADNASPSGEPSLIAFSIPTTDLGYSTITGAFTIEPLSALPAITVPVALDGYTQPGASPNTQTVGDNAVLNIVLDGGGSQGSGLTIDGGNSTVEGLMIQNFNSPIDLASSNNNVAGDSVQLTTPFLGVFLGFPGAVRVDAGSGNTIGGTTPAARNVIGGSFQNGIRVVGAQDTIIEGNYIGTDASGSMGTGGTSGFRGVVVLFASDTTIGGTSAAARNVISGWGQNVRVGGSTGTVVEGNYIGTDASGLEALSGGGGGIGVVLGGRTGNTVAGNTIAFDSTGVWDPITGGDSILGNSIYGNSFDGVDIGVARSITGVPIVTDVSILGNSIYGNGGDGVDIRHGAGISIRGNSIYGNGGLGIVLNGGLNTNADNNQENHQGPNNLMNFPVLTSVQTSAAGTTINGTLDTGTANGIPYLANATITLDFYANSPAAVDPSGYGQGQTWLGSMTVTTDANGHASFTSPQFGMALPAGDFVSATATDGDGDTSEFSADIPVGPTSGGPYTILPGSSATFLAAAGPSTNPTGYYWLINGQAYGSPTDNTGYDPTLTWAQLQADGIEGPGSYTVQALWFNSSTTVTLPATTLTVETAPATATITTSLPTDDSGNPTATAGTPVTLNSSVTDPNTGNAVASYAWSVVKHAEPTPLDTTLGPATQYATRILGESSDIGASPNPLETPDGSGPGALGAPDGGGWVPDRTDSTPYLTLGFDTPVYADGVTIWENAGGVIDLSPPAFDYNGFVTRVDLLDTNGQFHTVWTGTDPTNSTSEAPFTITWAQTSYQVEGVRIYSTNFNDWPQQTVVNLTNIDAVQLSGSYDPTANGSVPLSGSYDPAVNRGRSDQYATSVLPQATSSYQGVNVAVGAPSTTGLAWSPATVNGPPETLAVGFAIPVYADGVTIREGQGNGFVTGVDVLPEGADPSTGWINEWTGTDPTLPGAPADFRVNWAETPFLVSAVRIDVDNNHDPDVSKVIDSVQLHGWFTPGTVVASGTGPGLTFTPSATDRNATYFATLTATDSLGNVAMTQSTIDVASPVPLTAHLSSPTYSSGQVGLTLTASNPSPTDQAASFTIDWGDGSGVQTIAATNGSATPSHAYAAPGTYPVIVTATDAAGVTSATATAVVFLSTAPADHILLGGGIVPGQVSLRTAATSSVIYSPTDLVDVVGQDPNDTYTVNFGPNLTTPIIIDASGGSLDANGADGDNYFDKVLGQNGAANQLSWAPVYGPAPPVETVTFSGTSTTVLVGGSGSNYFIDPGSGTTLEGGPAANTFVVTATSGSGLSLEGGPSTNNYVIDLGSLAGPVLIDNSNPGAVNSLVVNGAAGNNTITASGSQVTAGSQTITLNTALTSATINGGSGNNQITVSNLTVPVQDMTLNGGGGNNTFSLDNVGADVTALTIAGGSGPGTNQVQVKGSLPPNLVVRRLTPTVVGTASTATPSFGKAVTFTANVTANASGIPIPTGSVDFFDTTTNTDLGSVTLSGGKATLTTATLPVGTQTITASYGGDANYLPSSGSATVSVTYVFSGFLPPLSQNLSYALNRTIPIKFQLTDANGHPITSPSAVTSLQVAPVVNGVAGTPFMPASTNNQGLQSTGGQYLYNWQTKGLAAGTYEIVLTLADGTTHTRTIQLTASGGGSNAQAADGSDVSSGSSAGQLLGGDLAVYVDNGNGELTPDELARIQDAVTALDAVTEPYGVTVEETTDPGQAAVTLGMGATSPVGGYADGILGCFDPAVAQITMIQGWNWYAGADPAQIGAGQYDFQTTLTHELGHALGLGESADPTSAMYGTLAPATAIRTLTAADLNVPYNESGSDAQRAAAPPAAPSPAMTSPSAVTGGSSPAAAPSGGTPAGPAGLSRFESLVLALFDAQAFAAGSTNSGPSAASASVSNQLFTNLGDLLLIDLLLAQQAGAAHA
jgi:hypothetical protein